MLPDVQVLLVEVERLWDDSMLEGSFVAGGVSSGLPVGGPLRFGSLPSGNEIQHPPLPTHGGTILQMGPLHLGKPGINPNRLRGLHRNSRNEGRAQLLPHKIPQPPPPPPPPPLSPPPGQPPPPQTPTNRGGNGQSLYDAQVDVGGM
jgi:hypothetical protein